MLQQLKAAAAIVDQLDDWVLSHYANPLNEEIYSTWRPSVVYTVATLEIMVGDVVVFCDQADAADEMTFENCRNAFLQTVRGLQPFAAEAAQLFEGKGETVENPGG